MQQQKEKDADDATSDSAPQQSQLCSGILRLSSPSVAAFVPHTYNRVAASSKCNHFPLMADSAAVLENSSAAHQ